MSGAERKPTPKQLERRQRIERRHRDGAVAAAAVAAGITDIDEAAAAASVDAEEVIDSVEMLLDEAAAAASEADDDDGNCDFFERKKGPHMQRNHFVLKRFPAPKGGSSVQALDHHREQLEPIWVALKCVADTVNGNIILDTVSETHTVKLVLVDPRSQDAIKVDQAVERLRELVHNRIAIKNGEKIGLLLTAQADQPQHEINRLKKEKYLSKRGGKSHDRPKKTPHPNQGSSHKQVLGVERCIDYARGGCPRGDKCRKYHG
jgi:hypothetical protein